MTTDPVRGAYRGAAGSWAEDASLAYVPLARHLLGRLGGRLPGPEGLDVGAGTGAVGDVLRELGARVTSVDLEHDMLLHRHTDRCRALVADVARLPLRAAVFDVTVAGFLLNHVADHVTALRELRRVTRPGGVALASVFAAERSVAKEAVDGTLRAFGWTPPHWYDVVRERADAVGTPALLESRAAEAGWDDVSVRGVAVAVGLDEPAAVVRYRLGLAHASSFVARMTPREREALTTQAAAAVAATREPFRPVVLELMAG